MTAQSASVFSIIPTNPSTLGGVDGEGNTITVRLYTAFNIPNCTPAG